MSTAHLFVEAVDTAVRLGWALAGWVIFGATVAAILLLAAIATGAWGVRELQGAAVAVAALRTHRTGPLADEQPVSDSSPAIPAEGRSSPHAPSWAQPDEEAA